MPSSNERPSDPGAREFREGDYRIGPRIYRGLRKCVRRINGQLRVADSYSFEDRRTGSTQLICVVAFRKRDLWPLVLPHVAEAAQNDYVCVISPGLYDHGLSDLCEQWGWSYLSTATRDANLAQNICFWLHQEAQIIVKIDEDMIVPPTAIADLINRHRLLSEDGEITPGVTAPTVPLEGLCYRYLLELLELLKAFELRFGKAMLHADDSVISRNIEAAIWIWEKTSPLTQTAEALNALPEKLIYAPIVVNPGMIVFDRSFWDEMGDLPVFRRRLMFGEDSLGTDHRYISSRAVTLSRPVVITSHVLVGRFSFNAQYTKMLDLYRDRPEIFSV
ncbi:MAG: hypothetical protein ACK5JT_03855 [Hyphomicrobiaceae bacterium]